MLRVCVIGAGASGLVAARELIKAGFEPIVYERHRSEVTKKSFSGNSGKET